MYEDFVPSYELNIFVFLSVGRDMSIILISLVVQASGNRPLLLACRY